MFAAAVTRSTRNFARGLQHPAAPRSRHISTQQASLEYPQYNRAASKQEIYLLRRRHMQSNFTKTHMIISPQRLTPVLAG